MRLPLSAGLAGGAEHLKRRNRQAVLALVRAAGTASRADLTRATAMSPQAMSNIMAELEAARLIRSAGRVFGAKGQPPMHYRIDPGAGSGIGLHLDRGTLHGVRVDFALQRQAGLSRRVDATSAESLWRAARDAVAELLPPRRRRVWGIGIASPRLLDERLVDVPAIEGALWADLHASGFDARLSAETGLPVVVENDANAGALGEMGFVPGPGRRDFCYLYLGRGLGLGIVQAGVLVRGAYGNAGEVGLVPLLPVEDGKLERRLSLDGAEAAASWRAAVAPLLRWTVAMLEDLFDPERIVLGSDLPAPALARLLQESQPWLPSIASRLGRAAPRVEVGPLGAGAIVLGAASLPLRAALEPEPAAAWAVHGRFHDVYAGRA